MNLEFLKRNINNQFLILFPLAVAACGSKRKPQSFKDEDYYISSIPKNLVSDHLNHYSLYLSGLQK